MEAEVPAYAVQGEVRVDPASTAVVVIDMQNDLVKQGGSLLVPDAEATIPAIERLLDLARTSRMRVIYGQDTHRRGDPEWEIWPEHCREGSWGWEIVDELAPRVDETVLRKVRHDAFYGTPLDHLLTLWRVETLVICGTVANIGVQYTAASAALRWYAVVIPHDAISALEPFDLEATLRQTAFVFAGQVTTADGVCIADRQAHRASGPALLEESRSAVRLPTGGPRMRIAPDVENGSQPRTPRRLTMIAKEHSLVVRFQTVDGVRIRYADSGGSKGPTLLLTSPWPESVYAFASMWGTLAEHARLFAVDLPGFGASERRDDLLSPRAMGGFLANLIAEVDLDRPHLVAPDVGTSAALFAAAEHAGRIASVVVGTGGAAIPIQLGEPLRSWVLDPDLDRYRRMDPRAIVNVAVDTIAGGVPDDIRADYLACYDGDRFVESMRYVRRYPVELPALAALLPQIAAPVTIINGRHDRVVPIANAEFLDERLPNSRVVLIDAGHFVWEEAPAEYAAIILDAISANGS